MYVEWALADQMYGSRGSWFFETPKLMIRDITGTHRLELAIDRAGLYCDHTVLCALRHSDIAEFRESPSDAVEGSCHYSLALLQGLLASRLVSAYYYWKLTGEGVRTGGGFHTYPKTVRALPIFHLEELSKAKAPLATIASLAEKASGIGGQYSSARTPDERTRIKRQFDATDRQIDELVYELYGLTDKEIAIVEETTRGKVEG
jgi:hypothetical protein